MNEDDFEEEKKNKSRTGSDWLGSRSSIDDEENKTEALDKDLGEIIDSQGRKKFKVQSSYHSNNPMQEPTNNSDPTLEHADAADNIKIPKPFNDVQNQTTENVPNVGKLNDMSEEN